MSDWIKCAQCKEPFRLHPETEATLRRSSATFHCPWGHRNVFAQGKSEADKLREQLAAAQKRLETAKQNEAYYEDRIDQEKRRAAAARGQVTRLKNRVSAGVCPCCSRTFQNLQAHMAGQHPGFVAEPVAGDEA